MTYYTGLDVSLRSVSICIVDDQGQANSFPCLKRVRCFTGPS